MDNAELALNCTLAGTSGLKNDTCKAENSSGHAELNSSPFRRNRTVELPHPRQVIEPVSCMISGTIRSIGVPPAFRTKATSSDVPAAAAKILESPVEANPPELADTLADAEKRPAESCTSTGVCPLRTESW